MLRPPRSISRNFFTAAVLTLCASAALATLGRSPSTASTTATPASSTSIKAAAATAPSGLYVRSQVQLANGTVVNEFTNTDGIVFAVTWVGPVLPDLNSLLGNYFKAFMDEAQRNRAAGKRGAPINLNTDGLVVLSSGRMGHFSGYAHVPALTPAGVSITDLLP